METTREWEFEGHREAAEAVNPEVCIVCHPGEVVGWERFCGEEEYQWNAIALDGYIEFCAQSFGYHQSEFRSSSEAPPRSP